jgi:hypothetical protein
VSIPIRIAVRVDFEDGSQHEYEVLGPAAVAMPEGLSGAWRPEPVTTRDKAAGMARELERQQEREFFVRLLRVVADDDDLDPAEVEFAVITAGREGAVYWPWAKGEIVAVPVDGYRDLREGRGFHKYDIGEERFGRDWEAAKRRSDEVKAGPDVDMFAQAKSRERPPRGPVSLPEPQP